MAGKEFFDVSLEQSEVKAAIVSKYFWAWAKVIMPRAQQSPGRIAYIDLFAGPGRYKDTNETESTPLHILRKAIDDPVMSNMLVTWFNDVNSDFSSSLQQAIDELPGIESLRYRPMVFNEEVGTEIVKQFEEMTLVPTLFFVDPWGYKGLSLRLINAVLKDWACECIFFFNYNRINMGLGNEYVEEHMDALFGKQRADELRSYLNELPPDERELAVVEAISQALKELGGKYVLPFRFRNERGTRTSHHLIFVSKNVLGYTIMKEIMAKESSARDQGVASFEYNPATRNQPLLFELAKPLDELAGMLLEEYAGRTMRMVEVYEGHHVGRQFIKSNYKQALAELERGGKITASPPAVAPKGQPCRRKGTFADDVVVKFPGWPGGRS